MGGEGKNIPFHLQKTLLLVKIFHGLYKDHDLVISNDDIPRQEILIFTVCHGFFRLKMNIIFSTLDCNHYLIFSTYYGDVTSKKRSNHTELLQMFNVTFVEISMWNMFALRTCQLH